ncbi:MAG TPA: tryptophan synthase subunit alpha [Pyrinomonadaceae bacterium]|nr:tryptophan synthase subunit alpha [Pyrinomonadaceae bacterium]
MEKTSDNALESAIRLKRRKGTGAFIPFITAGDPSFEISLEIMKVLAEKGADVIELGVPFSDPVADGTVIQASSARALANGVNFKTAIELVKRFRELYSTPIVIFSYVNPILRFGLEEAAKISAEAGANGILITDAVDEEAKMIGKAFSKYGISRISLVAPTTSESRLRQICSDAEGFIYAIARTGVTGEKEAKMEEAKALVKRIRQFTQLPVAVGFGISLSEHILEVWRFADAAVVGSAIVKTIDELTKDTDFLENFRNYIQGLIPQTAETWPGR